MRSEDLATRAEATSRHARVQLVARFAARIRTYVLAEPDGTLGTVCIYQASSPEAIRDHAQKADLPADEILPAADMVIVRPDPTPTEA